MKKCPKCGTILDDSKKKCYMCGAEFGGSSSNFGDTFDKEIGANVSSSQDALFSEPEQLFPENGEEVTNNENNTFFSSTSSSKSNLFNDDINQLNSMQYDERNEIQKSVDSIFEKTSFKSKEEQKQINDEKERQQHEKEIRKQRAKERQAEAKAQKEKARKEKKEEQKLKKELERQEKASKEQEKIIQSQMQTEAKNKLQMEQDAIKQQQLQNQAAARAQAEAERAEREALNQERIRIEREQQQLKLEQEYKEKQKREALDAEQKRLERERKQAAQAEQMKMKRESSYKKKNNTFFDQSLTQPQINWGNRLANNDNAMDFEDSVSKPKFSINLTTIFNMLSVVFLIGALIFVYVKFLKPESNDNVNLGGLIYSVNDEFKLSNEDGSTKYYTYGKSCALRVTYGAVNDTGSFIDNYMEDIKNQYSSNETNLTSKSTMELNGNVWTELSIRKIDASGTENSPVKYRYVSIVYKGSFYHTVFVNPEGDQECQKMYEEFIKTMKFE